MILRAFLIFFSFLEKINQTMDDCLVENDEVHIGEWCIFLNKSKLFIGLVLSFSYMNGKTYRSREYSRSFAPIPSEASDNPIGALCTHYRWSNDGKLQQESEHPFYSNLENYKATIATPDFEDDNLRISSILLNRIINFNGNCFE